MKERIIMCRAVDPRILLDNANHNIFSALADLGIYTCRDRVEFFGKPGMYDVNRVKFQVKSRIWDMHFKAMKLGVSINWLLYHVPRDRMPKAQKPAFAEEQKTVTKKQMSENIASHMKLVREETNLNQCDMYYLLTGDRDKFLYRYKSGGVKVGQWERSYCFPPIHVVAALARAEDVTVDHVLYRHAYKEGVRAGG